MAMVWNLSGGPTHAFLEDAYLAMDCFCSSMAPVYHLIIALIIAECIFVHSLMDHQGISF